MNGTQFVREENGCLLFGNAHLSLCFDLKTGNLLKITGERITLNASGLPDVMLRLGGETTSSLKTDALNVYWASQLVKDTHTEGADIIMTGYRLGQTQDGSQLRIEGTFGRFDLVRIYEITEEAEVVRRFELTYQGEEPEKLRGVVLYTPAVQDLTHVEFPSSSVPGTNPLSDRVTGTVAENLYDIAGEGVTMPRGENTMILHDKDRVLCAYNALLHQERCNFTLVQAENGYALRHQSNVSTRLAKGSTISFGEQHLLFTDGCWYDTAYDIGRRYERLGYRVNPGTPRSELKNLVIYETEIGIVQFRPDKFHSVYKTLDELTADLPRLRDIGYNCIQLMPSFPFPAYTVYDLHRPEWQHAYGADLKPFIQRAHELGMKVIFDILLHGIIDKEIGRWDEKTYCSRKYYYPEWARLCEYEVAPLRQQHPDWFIHQDNGEIFRVYTWSFDWANRGLQDWLIDALAMYVRDLDVDGFRFDAPTWVNAANWIEGLPYRADRSYLAGISEGFARAREKVDPLKKNLVWLTEPEYIALRHSLDVTYTYSTLGMWPRIFSGEMTAAQLQEFYAVRKRINPVGALYVNWMDNHDSWNDGTNETGEYSFERFSPTFARSLLALALFQEGAYMAYAGNELLDPEYYRRLVALRRQESIFSEGDCSFEAVHAQSDSVICMLWTRGQEKLLVAVNMTAKPVDTLLDGAPDGRYVNRVAGGCWTCGSSLHLEGGECALLKLL